MPLRIPRVCRKRGCANTTTDRSGYCEVYWRFLENGTSKMAPQPFIRPAFDGKADEAADLALSKLSQAIDKVLSG